MHGTNSRRLRHARWLGMPLKLVAAGVVLVSLIGVAAVTFASPAMAQSDDAVTPPNNSACVFSTFGSPSDSVFGQSILAELPKLKKILEKGEHYTWTEYVSSTEGVGHRGNTTYDDPGDATLTNFARMTGRIGNSPCGVVIINSHGVNSPAIGEASFVVEVHQTVAEASQAAVTYQQEFGLSSTQVYAAPGVSDYPPNTNVGEVMLSASGIRALYSGQQTPGIIFAGTCESNGLGNSFGTNGTFFGYSGCPIDSTVISDLDTVFNDLAGNNDGQEVRTTAGIEATPGSVTATVDAFTDMSLSPAVDPTATTPQPGGTVTDGSSYQIGFDTQMNQSNTNGVVTISGCGAASISDVSWSSPTSLSYTVNVPTRGNGKTGKLTVEYAEAVAGAPGWPNTLDGNKHEMNGQAPTGNSYTEPVTCFNSNSRPPKCSLRPPQKPTLSPTDFYNCWIVGSSWVQISPCQDIQGNCAYTYDPGGLGSFSYTDYGSGGVLAEQFNWTTTLGSVNETTGTITDSIDGTYIYYPTPPDYETVTVACNTNENWNVYSGYGTWTYTGTITRSDPNDMGPTSCNSTGTYQAFYDGNGYVPPCAPSEPCTSSSSANRSVSGGRIHSLPLKPIRATTSGSESTGEHRAQVADGYIPGGPYSTTGG
jgi:hypothetical protein